MKKSIALSLLAIGLTATSCKRDDNTTTTATVDISVQNDYDVQAIQQFLKDNYFDSKGNIVAFDSNNTADDNEKPLSDYNPQTLESGVVYIVRPNAQPDNGTTIGATDSISLMHKTMTYVATKEGESVKLRSPYTFYNAISGTGIPQEDPSFYYVKNSVLTSSGKTRSYYEIEGFQEALKYFKSFNQEAEVDYNLQGVIIVPSKAAFARDAHFNYAGYSLNDRTFVFNFQVYKTSARTSD
ncbi:hypothetical protein [Riemerella anatipestifer]|uniref:hypothetical protein n=1 Tax=Riemerella anatipestifer TaxID=34085 RepID=UPI003DA98E90